MHNDLVFAAQLAREVGDLLADQFQISGTQTTIKDDRSVVTEADLAAERLIYRNLQNSYPDDAFLSEEYHATLSATGSSVWVVDPLDGTTNFSLGLHLWGTSIARVENGWPVTAAIYFPLIDELYTAQQGQGAFLNGQPIQAKPFQKDQPAAFFCCCARTFRRYHVQVPFKARILGSAAYSFCAVARGSALIAFETTPKIWDIAGAWLLIREAGGVIEPYEGLEPFPLTKGINYSDIDFTTLAAATPELLARARGEIRPK